MKKIFYIAIMFCAAFTMSCSRDALDVPQFDSATEGLLNISFNLTTKTRAALADYDNVDVKFYKKEGETKSLIRHYTSVKDIPASLYLIEGDYCVKVKVDNAPDTKATFDGATRFYGEKEFTITRGETTSVEVECNCLNTLVKVVFDESIEKRFDVGGTLFNGITTRYMSTVVVSDEWTENYSNLPYLDYLRQTDTNEQVGYYVLPVGAENISYAFHGFSYDPIDGVEPDSENPRLSHVKIYGSKFLPLYTDEKYPDGTREGVMYTLKFKYTESAPELPEEGYISVEIEISADDWKVKNDVGGINPAENTKLEGPGVDNPFTVTGDNLEYTASFSRSTIDKIDISWPGGETKEVVTTSSTEADGVKVDRKNDGYEIALTLGAEFLNNLKGGNNTLTFTFYTADGQDNTRAAAGYKKLSTAKAKIVTSGTYDSLVSTDCWNAKGQMSAYVYKESASNVEIRYRAVDTQASWTTVAATSNGNNVYTIADVTGINANTEYEYQLIIDSAEVGAPVKTKIGDGKQMPNSGFETWTGSSPLLPYGNGVEQWWDTGNHGAATIGGNVTTNAADAHSGRYSAYLNSQNVVVKFAAGNIFVGAYVATAGTNGLIGFGKEFAYDYKPKAIRFWYKGNVGSIDKGSGAPGVKSGDSDVAQFYCLLCSNMKGPHIVDTRDNDTFMNIDSETISYCTNVNGASSKNDATDGHIVGCASWEKSQTQITKTDGSGSKITESTNAKIDVWTMVEIPINYNSTYGNEMPNYILVTASASKYGDYFMGSTKSEMYIDDVELVY